MRKSQTIQYWLQHLQEQYEPSPRCPIEDIEDTAEDIPAAPRDPADSSIIIIPNVIYLLPRLDMILCSVIISLKS